MNHSQSYLEIDISKIRDNYKILSSICKTSEVACVIKANAYGLGADKISNALFHQEKCQNFFVASVNEAIDLRKNLGLGANIFVLNGVFRDEVDEFARHNLTPILNHLGQIELWTEFTKKIEKRLPSILHIDTGMSRLGMPGIEVDKLISKSELLDILSLEYVMSHLSSSEEVENQYNLEQLRKFKHYLKYFPKSKASLSNSSSIFLGKDYHFDLVRTGAALYGINPNVSKPNIMHNVVKLTTPIIQLQKLSSSNFIGYNMTFTTKRNTIVATLPIGYSDGYSRILSNCGEVFIDGHIVPVVGRVSMDLITIDVTDVPSEKIFLGQKVEIINDYCTIDKIASIVGTIGQEALTILGGSRYNRIYKNNA